MGYLDVSSWPKSKVGGHGDGGLKCCGVKLFTVNAL